MQVQQGDQLSSEGQWPEQGRLLDAVRHLEAELQVCHLRQRELHETISSTQHKWRAQETRLHKEVTSLTSLLSEQRYMTDRLIETVRTEQFRTAKCEQTLPLVWQEVHGTANHDAKLCAKMTNKEAGEDAEVSYLRYKSECGETEGHILKQQENKEVELRYKSTQELMSSQHMGSIKESLRLRIQKGLQAKIEEEADGMQQRTNGTLRGQSLEQGVLQALEEHLEICRRRQREMKSEISDIQKKFEVERKRSCELLKENKCLMSLLGTAFATVHELQPLLLCSQQILVQTLNHST